MGLPMPINAKPMMAPMNTPVTAVTSEPSAKEISPAINSRLLRRRRSTAPTAKGMVNPIAQRMDRREPIWLRSTPIPRPMAGRKG